MNHMGREKLLRLEELAVLIKVSGQTINNWYSFKKQFPENKYAKMLPEFVQQGNRRTRYWKESDVGKILMFAHSIPIGRNGVMGAVTQKYIKKKGEKKTNERGTNA